MNLTEAKENLIFECIAGSHAYGTNTVYSDTDIRGIFQLPPAAFLSLERPPQQVSDDKNDVTYWELRRYFELAANCNPNIIEIMWTPEECITQKTRTMALLLNRRAEFISKKAYHTFSGYAHSQIKRAKGQNKWVNNPKSEAPPDKLDYCRVIFSDPQDPSLQKVLGEEGVFPQRPQRIDFDLDIYHCASVEHLPNAYRLYRYGNSAKGVFRGPNQQLVCESIPKEDEWTRFAGLLIFNEPEYDRAVKDHRNYWEWKKNRSEERYRTMEAGEIDYDAKNMMHCFRLLWSGKNILQMGEPIVRFDGEALELLRDIRSGKYSHAQLMKWVEDEMEDLKQVRDQSSLPEKINRKSINTLYADMMEEGEQ